MIERGWMRRLDSFSDNRKSKIQNRKWVRLSVIAFVLVLVGAAAQAQQPKKFELIINLRTVKALGISVPLALSGRADELIE